jgi:4-amino-4-deoxy-L-arabinose transferase-like glycosyltransferase
MQRRNPQFVEWFFVHEHFTRFLTTEHRRSEPWWYFSVLLLAGVLPWIAPVARGFLIALRAPPAGAVGLAVQRFLAVWAAAIFIFYAPSGSKLAPYILPMLPPLALLAGSYLASRPLTVPALRGTLWCALLLGLLLVCSPWLVEHINGPADRRGAYERMAHFAMLAGVLLLLATALTMLLERLHQRPAAVATLAAGWIASLALISNGSNELEAWKGGNLLARDVAPHLRADTRLFCLDRFPQTTIFALAHTCTIVGDAGELEVQFDDEEQNWMPVEEFAAAWNAAPAAVAIVEPNTLAKWQVLAPGATVIVNKPYGVVLLK